MKLDRAYSLIQIKALDEEARILEGIATTPTPDRIGDIVVSEGAEFKLPLPLLMHHNSKEPIGHVTDAKITKAGIHIKARIASIAEEGTLKNRLTEAWQMVKSGLVQGLSIGFKSLESEEIKDSKNANSWFPPLKHTKWLWLELSAVTIPANGEATITAIKAIDTEQRAASGQSLIGPVRLLSPGVSGKSTPKLKPKEGEDMKTIAEQMAALEATRAAKQAAMEAVMQKSIEEGRSSDDAEREEFDTLEGEVEAIDGDLKRLRALEKVQMAKAKPVDGVKDAASASDVRSGNEPIIVREPKVGPGIRLARIVRCMGMAYSQMTKGNFVSPVQLAEQLYKHDPVIANVLKANVTAGSTASGNWAEGLVGAETSVFADFVEFLRPMTIIGKFGNGGIPALRTVPFRVALVGQTGGGAGYWVGEGKAKPLTAFDFSRTTLEPLKVANIAVLTEELIRDSSPSAETIIRDSLVNALRERLDLDFIDPDKAASSGVSPASILNGVTAIASSGNDADAIRVDLAAIFGAFIAANNPPTNGVWVMSSRTALTLSLMMNPLGQPEFPGLTMNGGTFAGLPVITSEYITPDTSGDYVALVNASDIYVADNGDFAVDMSREASLEMSDAPAHNSTTPTAAQLVSMFQTNSVAFRAERSINWKRRRNEGVAWLNLVHWGEATT
jgi:HK97 family phage prohead protease